MPKRYEISDAIRLEIVTPSAFASIWYSYPLSDQRARLKAFLDLLDIADAEQLLSHFSEIDFDNGTFTALADPSVLRPLILVGAVSLLDVMQSLTCWHPEIQPLLDESTTTPDELDDGISFLQDDKPIAFARLIDTITSVYLEIS